MEKEITREKDVKRKPVKSDKKKKQILETQRSEWGRR